MFWVSTRALQYFKALLEMVIGVLFIVCNPCLVILQNTSKVCLEIHGLRYEDYFIEHIVYIAVLFPSQ